MKSTLPKKLHKSGQIKPHGREKRKTKFHWHNLFLPLESSKIFPETKMSAAIRKKSIIYFYKAYLPMKFDGGKAKFINSALSPQWQTRDCCCLGGCLLNSSSFFLPHLLGLASCQTSSVNLSRKVISFHCSLRTQILARVFQIFS